jgi:molecular chaperone GrpE
VVEENKTTSENRASDTSRPGNDMQTLEANLTEEKDKTSQYLANWQRAEADFSNYKKRAEQEKTDITTYANSSLILNLLPVLDDMERAIVSLPPKFANASWTEGIKLIHRKFKSVLESQGLIEVESVGKPFDHNFHEAVAQIDGEEGIILNEVQKGYILKNRILRPASVVVGKGNTEKIQTDIEEEQQT